MIYLVGALFLTNLATLVILYKLVIRLLPTSEAPVAAPFKMPLRKKVPFNRPKADPRGRAIKDESGLVPLDEIDPEMLMQSLAESTGRLEDIDLDG